MKQTNTCPLCLEQKAPVNSHIVPKFFWRRIKENGQYKVIDLLKKPGGKEQDELTEHMLCKECDNIVIREYETILANTLYSARMKLKLTGYPGGITLSAINYHAIKRAILSIVWRMHHSSKHWRELTIPDADEKRIRRYLNKEIVLGYYSYPILISAPMINGTTAGNALFPSPFITKPHNASAWNLYLQGMYFTIFLSDHFVEPNINQVMMKPTNEVFIMFKEMSAFKPLRELAQGYKQQLIEQTDERRQGANAKYIDPSED